MLVVMVGGLFFIFQDRHPVPETEREPRDSNQVLSQIEQEINSALKSGGINPDRYDEIDHELLQLEEKNIEPERIAALRALMAKIEVGGRTPQQPKSKSEESPSYQTPVQSNPTPAQLPESPPPQPQSEPEPQPEAQASCQSNPNPVFTNHITDTSKINYIAPPPTLGGGPSLKTHSYIGTDHARVPVYAPVDMTLAAGSYYVYGPYGLDFRVSCEVKVRFGHITEPIEEIKSVFPDTPAQDSKDQKIDHEIFFKAGDLIAYTTGTSAAGNWDFGVYNSTVRNRYADDPDWNNSAIYTSAVCSFGYFIPGLKSVYVTKFNPDILGGNPPHGESFCQ